jgi:hypothetical protein
MPCIMAVDISLGQIAESVLLSRGITCGAGVLTQVIMLSTRGSVARSKSASVQGQLSRGHPAQGMTTPCRFAAWPATQTELQASCAIA